MALQDEGLVFAKALRHALLPSFPHVLHTIRSAAPSMLVAYLLGASLPHWPPESIELIDATIRPYLLSLAAKRKALKKSVLNGTHSSLD